MSDRRSFKGSLPVAPAEAAEVGYFPTWGANMSITGGQRVYAARWLGDVVVLVERPDNLISAVDANTGEVLWAARLGEELENLYTPIRRGDEVHVNSETRLFTLDARTGEHLRTANLPEPVRSGPTLQGVYAAFGSTNGKAFTVNVDTGVRKWRYDMASSISQPPVADQGEVFVVDDAGNYAMISLIEGELRWRNRTFGPVSAAPAAGLGDVLVASEDRALYALSRGTGRINWAYRSQEAFVTGPFVADRLVLQEDPVKGLVALDAFTGEPKWVRESTEAKPMGSVGGRLLMQTRNALLFVDPDTGETEQTLDTSSVATVIVGEDDALLLVSLRGQLLRMDPL